MLSVSTSRRVASARRRAVRSRASSSSWVGASLSPVSGFDCDLEKGRRLAGAELLLVAPGGPSKGDGDGVVQPRLSLGVVGPPQRVPDRPTAHLLTPHAALVERVLVDLDHSAGVVEEQLELKAAVEDLSEALFGGLQRLLHRTSDSHIGLNAHHARGSARCGALDHAPPIDDAVPFAIAREDPVFRVEAGPHTLEVLADLPRDARVVIGVHECEPGVTDRRYVARVVAEIAPDPGAVHGRTRGEVPFPDAVGSALQRGRDATAFSLSDGTERALREQHTDGRQSADCVPQQQNQQRQIGPNPRHGAGLGRRGDREVRFAEPEGQFLRPSRRPPLSPSVGCHQRTQRSVQ